MASLIDSSAVFAIVDGDDPDHDRATGWLGYARAQRESLVMHSYVAEEASMLIQRRLGPIALRAFHLELAPLFEFVVVDRTTHEAAVAALLAALPTKTSLVDYVSFEVMRERGIRRAFAFDPDFVTAGFETVP